MRQQRPKSQEKTRIGKNLPEIHSFGKSIGLSQSGCGWMDVLQARMSTERKQMIRLTWKRFSGALRMLAQSEEGSRAMVFALTQAVEFLAGNA